MTPIKNFGARRIVFWTGACVLISFGLYGVREILTPFIVALIAAYLLNPAVVFLGRMRIPRIIGTALLILCFFALVGTSVFYTLPFLKRELLSLAADLPSYRDRLHGVLVPLFDGLDPYIKIGDLHQIKATTARHMTDAFSFSLKALAGIFTSSLALANLVSLLILTPIITFYFLRDWPRLVQKIQDLLPRDQTPIILDQVDLVNKTLRGYLQGQTMVCVILAIFYSVGLSLTGVRFACTIGIATGFLAFIPYFGFLIGCVVGISVAFAQFLNLDAIGWVCLVFALGQALESYFLSPTLIGDRTGLHPVWMIFALLSGGILFGFAGILLAVPTAAVLGVFVRFGVMRYRESLFYQGRTEDQ